MTDRVDVAIVGAGAAGIAAARRLIGAQRSVLLIEALPRIGGRARTINVLGLDLDLGCGWFHSAERNPLAALADAMGRRIDRSEGAWYRHVPRSDFVTQDLREGWAAYERLGERLREDPPASDRAGDALARDERWRPFMDALSSYINGVELDDLSVADFIAYDDIASRINWRLPSGYGAFIAELGANVPTVLDTRARSVSERDDVEIETDRGTVRARAAIVTLSTNRLAAGAIRFAQAVDDHLHAASLLPLGVADKVYLSIERPDAVPAESHLLGRLDRAGTGSYYFRPFGWPVIECFLGGRAARALEEAGEREIVEFVVGELRDLLGEECARGLAPIALTRWTKEPTIGGSYSHALPGHADARVALARPVSERLCFAGEACSIADFSTAHGAWQSGIAAADWIERFL